MDYVVELVTDSPTNKAADLNHDGSQPVSFESARELLTEFVESHGGHVEGWFNHKGELRVGSAVVSMKAETKEALQDHNVELLTSGGKPFVARVEGTFFDIAPKDGIVIHPQSDKPGCTI